MQNCEQKLHWRGNNHAEKLIPHTDGNKHGNKSHTPSFRGIIVVFTNRQFVYGGAEKNLLPVVLWKCLLFVDLEHNEGKGGLTGHVAGSEYILYLGVLFMDAFWVFFAISMAPALSSKILQWKLACSTWIGIPCCFASFISCSKGTTSRVAVDKAIYSASVENRAISVWSLDIQIIGQLANMNTYPVLDLAVSGLSAASCLFHSPAWEASTRQSNSLSLDGCSMIPLFQVVKRYLPICFTGSLCIFLGFTVKRAHWWTA